MKTITPFAGASWLALTLSACGGDDPAVPAPNAGDIEQTIAPSDMLFWRDCGTTGGRQVQCAELRVPLDHDQPEGEQILIALNRVLAPAGGEHRGSLLYNPGGPGGSGKEAVRSLAAYGNFDAVAPGFDVVGFDPRGIGESSGIDCEFIDEFIDRESDDESISDAMTEAALRDGLEGVLENLAWLSEQCRGNWGALFDHMGSNQVVRDIERIRLALGDEKLNFLGVSYGTRLGALYAQEYPENVRAIVLDAPMQPRASIVNQVQGQVDAFLVMHERFFADCEAGALPCPPDPRSVFDALLASADSIGVLPVVLDAWELGLAYSLGATFLPALLQAQVLAPDPSWIHNALESVGLPDNDTSSFIQNNNVNCADNALPLLTLDEVETRLDDALARSPVFGASVGPIAFCNGWSVTADPVAPLTAPGAPPILVVGGTRDIRTPFEWAVEMAGSLESGVLLTSEHWGHAVVGDGSPCVDDAVRAYFLDQTLPQDGTVCPASAL